MTKFVSDDYEKVDRLLELREAAESRAARGEADASNRTEIELDADELFLGRLENGLTTLQLADYVLAWICMEDDGVRVALTLLANADPNVRRFAIMQRCYWTGRASP